MVVTPSCNLAPEQGEHLTFWGQGAFSSFSGEEKGFSLNGDVTPSYWEQIGALPVGKLGQPSASSGAVASHGRANDAEGEISSTMTGLFPYGHS